MNAQRLAVTLTIVNLLLAAVMLTRGEALLAQDPAPVLRGRALELVDGAGQIRGQFTVESDGEAVFRLRDESGTIRVKLGASSVGSGLLLLDETTEPGVQILARRSPMSGQRTTSINLTGHGGRQRQVVP
jgi:hypothetical protein